MSVLQGLYYVACKIAPVVFACVGVFPLGVSNPILVANVVFAKDVRSTGSTTVRKTFIVHNTSNIYIKDRRAPPGGERTQSKTETEYNTDVMHRACKVNFT